MPKGVYERTPEMNAANSARQMGHSVSEETRAAMSRTRLGVLHTSEHNAALSRSHTPERRAAQSKRQEESGANDVMRGGLDLVWHHVAYDFGRSDALRVRIKRKFHSLIHHPKGIGIHQRGYSLID